jgi:hypothetical protein
MYKRKLPAPSNQTKELDVVSKSTVVKTFPWLENISSNKT